MDKYIVLGTVGEGTYGTVAKCLNESTGLMVAMKRLRNPLQSGHYYSEMIVREINLLRLLRNDHVVEIIDVIRVSGYIYMVFPFMQCNLYTYLENNGGALTMDHTKECIYQVLKGLSYVHSHNVIHRDIKPENLLLTVAGIIKICDFGASRMFCSSGSLDMSTEVGTLWYQAPEMLMELKIYDTMVDIWSVGILFTELVNRWPLVTEETIDYQLYGIIEILGCKDHNSIVINEYLHNRGIELSIENQQEQPLCKSYTISNTALALRRVYPEWPTDLLKIVAHCLQLNPVDRMNAAQLLNMEFFTTGMFMTNFDKELENKLKYDKTIENTNKYCETL
ncbi:Protein kinase domain,Protein kinase-like domain,Protein kinase, ATP binding site,Serine/threonine- [Cinara cedri]|uniref:Protein kinase domain,Protein kinase-like domain,Protein kinase, ATP binding site,Serine/threonine n=1 Tax=Cinara cedri TaxID=506608 RepID=A0A5E4MAK4_9HEMI|nr:Protein kinase domain,Protein kinase-like domain,Protein kinase, ATP binding site,Serine/threonine- [Cinara cedri]